MQGLQRQGALTVSVDLIAPLHRQPSHQSKELVTIKSAVMHNSLCSCCHLGAVCARGSRVKPTPWPAFHCLHPASIPMSPALRPEDARAIRIGLNPHCCSARQCAVGSGVRIVGPELACVRGSIGR